MTHQSPETPPFLLSMAPWMPAVGHPFLPVWGLGDGRKLSSETILGSCVGRAVCQLTDTELSFLICTMCLIIRSHLTDIVSLCNTVVVNIY